MPQAGSKELKLLHVRTKLGFAVILLQNCLAERLRNFAGVVPSATLKTKDGRYVIIGGNGDSVYTRLMAAIGRPEMGSQNPLYCNNTERCKREDEIYEVGVRGALSHLHPGYHLSLQVPVLFCTRCRGHCIVQVIGKWVEERSLEQVLEVMAEARVPSGETACT